MKNLNNCLNIINFTQIIYKNIYLLIWCKMWNKNTNDKQVYDLNKKFNTIVHMENVQLFDNEFPYDNSKHSTTFLFGQFCDITKMIIICEIFWWQIFTTWQHFFFWFFLMQISKKISKILIKHIFWMKSLFPFQLHF